MSFLSKLFARFRKQKQQPSQPQQPVVVAPPVVSVPTQPQAPAVTALPEFVTIAPTGVRGAGKLRKYPRPNPGPGQGQDMNAWSYASRIAYMTNPETGKPYVDPNMLGAFALGYTPQRWTPDTRNFAAWVDYRLFESDWWDAEESARQGNIAAGQKEMEDRLAHLQPGQFDVRTLSADDCEIVATFGHVFSGKVGPWSTGVAPMINWFHEQGGEPINAQVAARYSVPGSQFMQFNRWRGGAWKEQYHGQLRGILDEWLATKGEP